MHLFIFFEFSRAGKVNRSAATNNLPPMTTPMALRAISSKAQAELALLYADGDEFQEEDADEQVSAEYSAEEEVEEEEENEITFKRGVKLNFDEVDD